MTYPAGGDGPFIAAQNLQKRIAAVERPMRHIDRKLLPGPTGESNRLSRFARPPLICLGPGETAAAHQQRAAESLGGVAVAVPEAVKPEDLTQLSGFGGVIWWGDADKARAYVRALAAREGAILPLITGALDRADVLLERHVCVDTTASGGNAELLAEVAA